MTPPPGADVLGIDAARSELRILVYRAGPLARFGHDHVIVNRALRGWVARSAGHGGGPSAAGVWSVYLEIPAAEFAVDAAEARSQEGADFTEDVPEEAKQGTRQHLLGEGVLDADREPLITVRGVGTGDGDLPSAARLTLRVAGHESVATVPLVAARTADGVTASAEFTLRQTALGLTPFSVMRGALQVRDDIRVKIRIFACT